MKNSPKLVSHDSPSGKNKKKPSLKREKINQFLIILTAKKSKIDFSAKVDNFCLFRGKGS